MTRGLPQGEYRGPGLPPLLVAAHELKSPLIVLRQLALSLERDAPDAASRHSAITMARISEQALRLTTDLTRTARLDGSMLTTEPLNPLTICEMVVRDMTPLYALHGRSLRLRSSARQCRQLVVAHRDLLSRIVAQLVDNALAYGTDSAPVEVSVHEQRTSKRVRIAVRDQGPALSLADWRLARTLTTASQPGRPGGSSLGLYIVEEFSRAMGASFGLIRHRDGVSLYIDMPMSEQLSLL